jgi:hypothetical protein
MNDKNSDPNHPTGCDLIEAQIDPFIAGLKAAGWAMSQSKPHKSTSMPTWR